MQKLLLCVLLSIILLFCFSQNQFKPGNGKLLSGYLAADKIYKLALKQSVESGNDESLSAKADSNFLLALAGFNSILPQIQDNTGDSLLFFIKIKTGYIHYYFDSLRNAKEDYLKALTIKKNLPAIQDSFQFTTNIFTGDIYYRQNQFDSALIYYKNAEQIAGKYSVKLAESERLYNKSGVMYYEMGNYRQARNYFEKAILLTDPSDQYLVTNYKINIASLLVKLDSLDAAESRYQQLLSAEGYQNEIYHNLAIISLKKHQYQQAITYLRKINYTNNKKSIDLFYNLGATFSALNENDSAEFYLQRAIAENLKWNGKRKNIQYGLILKYQADELARQQLFQEATNQYQAAVLQFVTGYNETDANSNPEEFQSAFSYINLFNTLVAKAIAFENWYLQEKNTKLLQSALQAYRSAFDLAVYVERTYDSDEARLFLGKIKHQVHGRPINLSLQLYDLTQKKIYLEQAYLFDQRNKASTLAFNVSQQEYRQQSRNANPLIREEAAIKSQITRISIRAAQLTDSIQVAALLNSIRDKEIELGKIREKLDDDPEWQERMAADHIPTVNQLQKKLDNNTALLSYHLSENELLIILLTQSRFEYYKLVINQSFFSTLESFKNALHNTGSSEKYAATPIAGRLYEKLVNPFYKKLIAIKRLIIIPDDELHYLPFEALQNADNNYLVERFAVQYQYSTALLERPGKKLKSNNIVSFAPFVKKGYTDSNGINFPALPSSSEEVKGLEGHSYYDQLATKENFLKSVNRYNTIHLATHASVNNTEPSRSYIAFYPEDANYKLFAPEISNLNLDSARLVILSACETGSGQLVKGEGLMSLSRAFAYAGCPDIITSLWKAEDQTTAYLTSQLHHYLDKGYTKDMALQQAKNDLLTNDKIDPKFKSPVYWAHLVFIGEYERTENRTNWWWIALAFIVGAILYKLLGKKKTQTT